MKIYGHPMSTCTRKVLMTLAEKGQTADLVVVDFAKGEHKQEPHLSRQPYGQIPALEDDDLKLYESRAMARYVDEKYPEPALSPKDAKGRAMMEQWISVEQSNFSPAAMKIVGQLMFNKMFGKEADMAIVAEGKAATAKSLDILEKHLEGKEYMAGAFGLADITYMPYFEYLYAAGVGDELVAPRKNVSNWWKRVSSRPTWKSVTASLSDIASWNDQRRGRRVFGRAASLLL